MVSRRFVFRSALLLAPLLVIAAGECLLRINQSGVAPDLVLKSERPDGDKKYFLNPRVDVAYCQEDLRGPEPLGFAIPRPDKTLRVFVVGESSVQGYPYSSEVAFPRRMQRILQRQLPGVLIEVLNAGIVGVSTLPLVDLVAQCQAAQPSIVVVYAGHNEFYGVGGVATNATLSSWSIPFRRMRLIQWFHTAGKKTPEDNSQLISRMPEDFRIPQRDPRVTRAAANYRRHIQSMIAHCRSAGIALILCSPVSNLRSQSPLASEQDRKILSSLEQTVGAELSAETAGAYLPLLRQLAKDHPQNASVHYRLAQCLELLQQYPDARNEYLASRDLDECRYRAPETCRTALRELTQSAADELLTFLDLTPAFESQSPHGIPGEELFLEHVHFTAAGHALMAEQIARQIVSHSLQQTFDSSLAPTAERLEDQLGLIPEDHLVALNLAAFIEQEAPFNQSLDAPKHLQSLQAKIALLSQTIEPIEMQAFQSLPNPVKVDDLLDGLGRAWLGQRNLDKAEPYFERSSHRRPWMPNGLFFQAVCAQLRGDRQRAIALLNQSRHTILGETPRLQKDQEQLEAALFDGPSKVKSAE